MSQLSSLHLLLFYVVLHRTSYIFFTQNVLFFFWSVIIPENDMFLLFSFCQGLMSVPSLSTLEGVKRYINAVGNTPSAIAPKQTVMLDWASKEDGSHILTITVGNKVQNIFSLLLYLHVIEFFSVRNYRFYS